MGTVKDNILYHLNNHIEKAEDDEENEVTMSLTLVKQIHDLINSQEIKEPLEDIVFFAGKPTNHSICYHALVSSDAIKFMQRDPNLHFTSIKTFNGVFEQIFKPSVKPIETIGNHFYCGKCGKRLMLKHRATYCPKCGRKVAWE